MENEAWRKKTGLSSAVTVMRRYKRTNQGTHLPPIPVLFKSSLIKSLVVLPCPMIGLFTSKTPHRNHEPVEEVHCMILISLSLLKVCLYVFTSLNYRHCNLVCFICSSLSVSKGSSF